MKERAILRTRQSEIAPPRENPKTGVAASSVNAHGFLRIKVKTDSGWKLRSTGLPDTAPNRIKAAEMLAAVVGELKAKRSVMGEEAGPVTVRAWARVWLAARKGADRANDETRLRLHVLPIIGELELTEVRPRHIIDIVERLKIGHAPRTVRNTYSALRAMFRDAAIHDLMSVSAPTRASSRADTSARCETETHAGETAPSSAAKNFGRCSTQSRFRCHGEFCTRYSAAPHSAREKLQVCSGVRLTWPWNP